MIIVYSIFLKECNSACGFATSTYKYLSESLAYFNGNKIYTDNYLLEKYSCITSISNGVKWE